ncbi:carbon-nitrogen family hydrolase [Leuconostoc pseudomesenteroides]|uniref:carbon-nitrogen family hydrolase n=1 Tax=Leuconostoc pseudomesenteroides TaxID=33968 RepID=UPI0011227DD1|nr:carbon-nitrogen family hydrolase [Leuconostoc pseudomesenteroides]TOZ02714.1 carbon-nitrogen hydrolase [Leuconostoc pseudomesenteroides]
MTLKVAIAQMNIALGQPEVNEQTVAQYAQKASEAGADILIYPEMWNTGYALTDLTQLADNDGEQSRHLLARLAKTYQLNIVGGSVATMRDGRFFNTMFVFNQLGQQVSRYDKAHLFGLMNEEKYIAAGSQPNTFELAGVLSSGVICYDIRFPEWVRTMMSSGPQAILYVSAEWPIQRIAQWQILLQARAIENQAFVVAANRVGSDRDNTFGGRSLVIDSLGNIVAQGTDVDDMLVIADIDIADETAIRGQIPVFSDRRPDLYR